MVYIIEHLVNHTQTPNITVGHVLCHIVTLTYMVYKKFKHIVAIQYKVMRIILGLHRYTILNSMNDDHDMGL